MCTRQYFVFCLFIIAFFMTKTLDDRATRQCTQIAFIISFIYNAILLKIKMPLGYRVGLQPIRGLSTKCLVMKLREYTTYNLAKLTFHFNPQKQASFCRMPPARTKRHEHFLPFFLLL